MLRRGIFLIPQLPCHPNLIRLGDAQIVVGHNLRPPDIGIPLQEPGHGLKMRLVVVKPRDQRQAQDDIRPVIAEKFQVALNQPVIHAAEFPVLLRIGGLAVKEKQVHLPQQAGELFFRGEAACLHAHMDSV